MYVHGIVNHWSSKARKQRLRESGTLFVKKKLKLLAERARRRVRQRHAQEALARSAAATPKTVTTATSTRELDQVLEVKVVSTGATVLVASTETSPLLPRRL